MMGGEEKTAGRRREGEEMNDVMEGTDDVMEGTDDVMEGTGNVMA